MHNWRVGTLLGTFGSVKRNEKNGTFAVGFLVPSRYKHHDIYDLGAFLQGTSFLELVLHWRCPCRGTCLRPANGLMHHDGRTMDFIRCDARFTCAAFLVGFHLEKFDRQN